MDENLLKRRWFIASNRIHPIDGEYVAIAGEDWMLCVVQFSGEGR